MKKIVWLLCCFVIGCSKETTSSSSSEETTSSSETANTKSTILNCITCRDILAGDSSKNDLLCNGTDALWTEVAKYACDKNAVCETQCKSLCAFNGTGMSQDCLTCLFSPDSRQDYLNCSMIGNE